MLLHSKYTSGQQARAEVLSVDGHRSRGDNAVHTLWGRGADARSTWDLPAGGMKQLRPCAVAAVARPWEGV